VAFGGGAKGKLKADINVTPLVDVVLVLLIIFMVVTPMLTRGRDVQLPIASSLDEERELPHAVVLTIAADKGIWLDNRKVPLASLTSELSSLMAEQSGEQVLIKADASVTVRDMRPVLQLLKRAKITDIGFAVLEQRGASQ
jgi:biopolymer transport protein TolR